MFAFLAAVATAADAPKKAPASPAVERGKYLVQIGSCNDCHTPWKMGPKGPEPDMTRMLMGHPKERETPRARAAVRRHGTRRPPA